MLRPLSPLAARLGALGLLATLSLGCAGSSPNGPGFAVDLPLSRLPLTDVHANWKQRVPQRYAYAEVFGDYRRAPESVEQLRGVAYRYGLRPVGPAFTLFYDDPGEVSISQLRARVCLPVAPTEQRQGPWKFDVLPESTVAYAFVEAPRGAVPLAYPGLLEFLADRGWVRNGPIREVYLHEPNGASDGAPLTEVQVPWVSGR